MNKLTVSCLIAIAAMALAPARASAVPNQVSFAGRLTGTAAGPLPGTVDMRFRLYSGAGLVWQELHPGLSVEDGVVFAALGGGQPLDGSVFTGASLELEIEVNGEIMSPRLPILTVPYAARAGRCDDADSVGGLSPFSFASALHDHDSRYLPLGSNLACTGTQKVAAISPAGDVVCGTDQDTRYTAAPGGGLALAGTAFGIAAGGVERTHIAGTEVMLYSVPAGCAGGVAGTLTTSGATCVSDQCPLGLWRGCGGPCNQNNPELCVPQALGYLLSPL